MRGEADFDPMTRIEKGQTVREIMQGGHWHRPVKKAKAPMSESRKTFLRMMGLAKWIH